MTGDALRMIRIVKGYDGKTFAKKMGINPTHLSRVEHGHEKVSMQFIEKFAAAVGERPSTIMYFCEEMDGAENGLLARFSRPVIMAGLRKLVENIDKDDG